MFQAIIWDFDGTLVDTYPAIAEAVNTALGAFGAQAPFARIVELSSISMEHCMSTLAGEHGIAYEMLQARFSESYRSVRPESQQPFPGVIALCNAFQQRNVSQYIVTHRRRASLDRLLATHQMAHFFSEIVAGDDGFPRKPNPHAILYLIERYQLLPRQTLLIGDRDLDILAGQGAGVQTCLFGSAFLDLAPDLCVARYEELHQALGLAAFAE